MPHTFEQSKAEIANLVKHFATNQAAYFSSAYKEAHARQEFIDPFFIALNWDVHNQQQAAPDYREVIVEDSLDIEGQRKAPDYAFRVGREHKFFAEAKKPGVGLMTAAGPAYQLRRYAWSAKLPLSLLIDFEEVAVYDCRVRPAEKDKPTVARVNYLAYTEYADRWTEIWDVFSREAVWGGSFDQFAHTTKGKRGTSEVDAEFLKEIEGWRDLLARNIALRNPALTIDELNDAVQRTIDRIIFLRMAEDRGVEPYGNLRRLAEGVDIYTGLIGISRKADTKYNSGLFDFSKAGDQVTPRLAVDDKALKSILSDLYYPQSPYEFSLLPAEILGNVYEQFLGKVIRLTLSHQARVEEKPEVIKAGGVYYTPAYIVAYIVKNTVGKQVEGKSPKQLNGFRVLDMACGSGSFLLGAYQYLLNYYRDWYTAHEPTKYLNAVWQQGDEWRLTTTEKKLILTKHIFGVDIDRQAVEVTKLSLLLKVLEGESDESIGKQMALLHERALPNLDKNIKCGNSLIGPDYFSGRLLPDAEELKRVNPFDWKAAFREAMAAGGFDAIIGNPPYVRIQTLREWAPLEVEAYKELYRSARAGNYDIYVVFVERGLSLLNQKGRLGFILPHKFFTANYGEPLRGLISQGQHILEIVHFADQQVFSGATTYTCLLFLEKGGVDTFQLIRIDSLQGFRRGEPQPTSQIPASSIDSSEWFFARRSAGINANRPNTIPLGKLSHIFQGLATSADSVYVLELVSSGPKVSVVRSPYLNTQFEIESATVHPILKGAEISRYQPPQPRYVVLFPYRVTDDAAVLFSRAELESRYPKALAYLEGCKTRLLRRKKVNKSTYWHYPYPKNLTLYGRPKILIQVLSTRGNFAADFGGKFYFVGGGTAGGNAIRLKENGEITYEYLLGILNSRLTTGYVKMAGSTFRGGYFAFGKGSLAELPIPLIDFSDSADKARHDKMVSLVEPMLELHRRQQAAESESERELLQRQIDATDREIDALVYELYRLTPEEITIVEGAYRQQAA